MVAAGARQAVDGLESLIRVVSPRWAVRREQFRRILSYYEAARPTTYRRQRREPGSGDAAVLPAGASLREQAHLLEQNHDLARGAQNILVANIVGPHGIGIEPQPRARGGEIHDVLARPIQDIVRDWKERPEVTWQHDWPAAQRLACRTWVRDGAALTSTPRDDEILGTLYKWVVEWGSLTIGKAK